MNRHLRADEASSFKGIGSGIAVMASQKRDGTRRLAEMFADHLRKQLPDVDDVLLGRVLLHAGGYVGGLANTPETHTLTGMLLVAAYDMTALERGESFPPA